MFQKNQPIKNKKTPKKTIGLTKNTPTPSKRTPSKVSPFEMFIREKLNETKDTDLKTQTIKRKRLTFDVGSIITSDEAIKKMEEQQQDQLETEMRKSKGGIRTKSGKLLPKKGVPVIENKKKTKKLKTIVTSSDSEQECSEIELKDSSSEWNELTSEESDNENAQSEKVNLLLEKYYTVYYDETWY
uniref:Uncharacterized protein n=1 Tax=Cuerna arida TaxID=1464854 RepID=A0A1B6H156_9HEMI